MSSSKSKSQANQTSNVADERFAAGDGSITAAGGSNLTINTLDADLVETVAKLNTGLAESGFDLAAGGLEIGAGIASEVLQALKEKDARQDSLVAGFRTVAQDTQTTLRDTLASALNAPALAGSAAQSGGVSGWIARNPALAALGAGVALALVLILRRPARK